MTFTVMKVKMLMILFTKFRLLCVFRERFLNTTCSLHESTYAKQFRKIKPKTKNDYGVTGVGVSRVEIKVGAEGRRSVGCVKPRIRDKRGDEMPYSLMSHRYLSRDNDYVRCPYVFKAAPN